MDDNDDNVVVCVCMFTVADVCYSFQLAKECGYKVVSHLMPDLPNMGRERDLQGFK